MNNDEENPWAVNNLEEFLYFCCPECTERNQSKELFLEHALNQHPKAKQCLQNLEIKKEINVEEEIQNYTESIGNKFVDYENNQKLHCSIFTSGLDDSTLPEAS